MENIIVGGAWPYANGSLHIGHIAALLPGDVLARYFRAKGKRVFYVSGSDCHGTPITIRAKQENSSPDVISEHYHKEFCEVFEKLGFSYDLYTKTSDSKHKAFVSEFHKKLYSSDYIEERTVKQAFCPTCNKVLTDRLVVGVCPACGSATRGDQCDSCGEVLEVDTVIDAKCADCGTPLYFGETTQLFLQISKLKNELCDFLDAHPYWRKNAIAFTKRYIDEGLRDRAITRDIDWGIDVPKDGYEDTDARWTKKGDEKHYGYKDHVKVDADSKLILDYAVTPANIHDSNEFENFFNEQDEVGYADSAYIGKKLPEHIRNEVCEKGYRNKLLTEEQKENNRRKSKIRCRIEHVFGFMTMSMHGLTVRSIGIARATFHIGLTNLVYNLCRYSFLIRKEAVTG